MNFLKLFGRDKPDSKATVITKAPRSRHPGLKVSRNYNAALVNNLTASWTTTSLTADQVIYQTLKTVRARAREQVANNDFARRFVGMAKTHIVGPDGFIFQGKTIGRDGKPDNLANSVLETHWKAWQAPNECDVTQQQSFNSILRLWVGTLVSDGEIIVRVRKGPAFGKYNFALELIDPELLDPTFCDDTKGRYIRHGIEFDEYKRPVAYYFKKSSGQVWSQNYNVSDYVRVPANEIYHDFIIERVGQKRGIPWLATPLTRMQMLEGYENAAITNARVGASKMGFYQPTEDANPDSFEGLRDEETGEFIQEANPGEFGVLPYGYQFQSFDPAYPNGEFDSFTKAALRGISAGLGVSYFKLANDLEGVNYSSGRLGELEDREIWKALQNWMIEGFLNRLYFDWLEWQLTIGTLTFNTSTGTAALNTRFIDKYKSVRFQGRRWQWTDPLKEANGNKVNLEQRLTSPQKVIRDSGQDPDDVINDWKQWQELLKGAGLTVPDEQKEVIEDETNETD